MVWPELRGCSYSILHAGANAWSLDQQLETVLAQHGFTGRIESTLERDWAAPSTVSSRTPAGCSFSTPSAGLNNDNNCSGCHAPTHGFGDTQSIAIGIDNNGIVGPSRTRPAESTPHVRCRQQRAFFPI